MSRRNNESGAEPRKRVLIPLWILQIVGASVSTLASILELIPSTGLGDDNPSTEAQFQAQAVYYAFFSALTLVLTVLEPILYCFHRLHPLTFLCLEVAKTVIMLTLFGRRIVEDALDGSNATSATAIIILAVILCFFLTTLIYSAFLYHRHRNYKKYNPVGSSGHSVAEPISGSSSEPLSSSWEYVNSPHSVYSGKPGTDSRELYEMGVPPKPVYETEVHLVHEMSALDNAHKLKPKVQEAPIEMA